MSYHQRIYHDPQENHRHGVSKNITHPKLPSRVSIHTVPWKPLPAWEKRFCVKVGAMSWKRFVQAKKNLCKTDKLYDWNDSAALMAFNEAKQRFWAEFHGFPCKKSLPSADKYIDKHVDWNPEIDPELFSEIKAASDDDDDDDGEEKEVVIAKEINLLSIPLDQIKPTGWEKWDLAPHLPKFVG